MFVTTKLELLNTTTSNDEYGDEVDTYTKIGDVWGHIGESSHVSYDPQSGRTDTVREYFGLLPMGTSVAKGTRLIDTQTGETYTVEHVLRSASPSSIRVELKSVE